MVLRKVFGPRRRSNKTEDNCIKRIFMICNSHQILLGPWNQGRWDGRAWQQRKWEGYRSFVRKLGVRSLVERNRHRWKYYIKGILKKYSGRAWIGLVCFRIGVTSVNTVLNLRVPYHARNSLSSRGAINFSRRNLLHGDSKSGSQHGSSTSGALQKYYRNTAGAARFRAWISLWNAQLVTGTKLMQFHTHMTKPRK
jgi:hypothetical protein